MLSRFSKLWIIVFLLLFLVLFAVSLCLVYFIIPRVIDSQIYKNTRLDKDTDQWDRFLELPFPLNFKVYIFQVENQEEYLNGNEKINITELGPFVYEENRKKTIVSEDDKLDTVSYTQNMGMFEFNYTLSAPGLSPDQIVTVLNPLYNVVMQVASDTPAINPFGGIIESCLKHIFTEKTMGLFIKTKVQDLLFDGLEFCDPTPTVKPTFVCSVVVSQLCKIVKDMGIKNIDIPDDDKKPLRFSYFGYKRNNPDGIYTINRGRDDIEKLGEIEQWEGSDYTQFWKPGKKTECDRIRGSDSTIFPPKVKKGSTLTIYTTDICRAMDVHENGKETYKGIHGLLFRPSKRAFYPNGTNAEKDCFCSKLTKDAMGQESCYLDGLIDMQPCIKVGILMSFPHFMWADKKYAKGVNGLSEPDEELHGIELLMDPYTGTPLKGHKRVQLNMVLRRLTNFKITKTLIPTVLPLLWIDEGIELSDDFIDMLNNLLFKLLRIVTIVKWVLVGVTAFLTSLFIILAIVKFSRR